MPKPRSAAARLTGSAPVFAALGDETRLRLVSRLCHEGAMSISRLAEGSELTRQAITKHLRVMEAAGILQATRRGRESIWQLAPERLEEARRCLDVISAQWDVTLDRLKKLVEE